MRTVIYARYSTDMQSETSIEDQVRQCRERAVLDGHEVIQVFSDHAISGSTLGNRPGMLSLMAAAKDNLFDTVYAEALDRISRDQEDIAGIFKRLTHADVGIVTLSEGLISELHVGLKGTMNALFLKDLAVKTRRGLEGRVRKGKSGGGNSYGYDVVKQFDSNGDPVRGDRTINKNEALVVHRIFMAFAAGISPRAIAHDLNKEGITGPRAGTWGASTIHGNWRRGTGILNNELYIGRIVWNRQRFIKDPNTGKRQARLNPESAWINKDVPDHRLIDDDLWQRVKVRQQNTRRQVAEEGGIRSERARRPRYLLSGLLKCGVCGGGFSKISQEHYGCSTARNKGICSNMLTIRRDVIEHTVLSGLKDQLMHPDAYKEFIAEFNRELNRLAASEDQSRDRLKRDLLKADRELTRLIEAIKSGVPGEAVKDEITALELTRTDLKAKLVATPAPRPRLHPNLADVYRNKVANLVDALNAPETVAEAAEAIRGLIEAVRLVPDNGTLKIELYGELSALLALGQSHKNKHPLTKDQGVQVTMVAGAGFVQAPTIQICI